MFGLDDNIRGPLEQMLGSCVMEFGAFSHLDQFLTSHDSSHTQKPKPGFRISLSLFWSTRTEEEKRPFH